MREKRVPDAESAVQWIDEASFGLVSKSQSTRLKKSVAEVCGQNATVAELCQKQEVDFLRHPNVGRKSVGVLQKILRSYGRSLKNPWQSQGAKPYSLEAVTAERDLLRARQKAIHRALIATSFDGERPMPRSPKPLPEPEHLARIADLEMEVASLKSRVEMSARIMWLLARAAGGTYSFDRSADPAGLGECSDPVSVEIFGSGTELRLTAKGSRLVRLSGATPV